MSRPSIFDACREVDARAAARALGLSIPRGGRGICPFCGHDPPTLSFTGRLWHCYCCGAAGDAVKLYELYHGIPPLEAARLINREFDCGYDDNGAALTPEAARRVSEARARREREARAAREKSRAREAVIWAEGYLRENAPLAPGEMTDEYRLILGERYLFELIWGEATERERPMSALAQGEVMALNAIREYITGSSAVDDDKPRGRGGEGDLRPYAPRRAHGVRYPFQRPGAAQGHGAAQGRRAPLPGRD